MHQKIPNLYSLPQQEILFNYHPIIEKVNAQSHYSVIRTYMVVPNRIL